MNRTLILYSTTDGHTIEICQKIQSVLENANHVVTVLPVESVSSADLDACEKIVIGASIRYEKHKKEVLAFITNNQSILENKISAYFSVNVTARDPNRNTPETNPYLKKFLSKSPWTPDKSAVFAGKIDYQKYNALERLLVRILMLLTKGPTDPRSAVEFTDWDKVESFAKSIGEMQAKT